MKKRQKTSRLFNYNNKSFYSKLLFSFLTILVTSMLLLLIFLTTVFSNYISSSTKNYNQQLLSQTNYTINQLDETVNRLKASLQGNKYISAYLSLTNIDNSIPVLANQEVLKQLIILPYIDSIYLYNANLDLLYSSKNGFQKSPDAYNDQALTSKLNNPDFVSSYDGSPILYKRSSETDSTEIFSYYIFHNTNIPGKYNAIIINLNTSILTNSILSMQKFTAETELNFLLLDKNSDYVTSILNSGSDNPSDFISSCLEKLSSSDDYNSPYIKINGTMYFQTHTNENTYGWYLFNLIPVLKLFKNIFTTILFSLAIIIIVFTLTSMLCKYFAGHLYEPLDVLTKHLKGITPAASLQNKSSFESDEFQLILSTVTSLQDNNEQLRSIQQKTKYSVTQSCLSELVIGNYADSPEQMEQKINYLGLNYLKNEKVCMSVFKIDHYHSFVENHTSDELWAIRFSIVSILNEFFSAQYTCNGFSCDNDKFVLVISCDQETDLVDFEDRFILLLQSAQKYMEEYFHFTVSTAYSNVFQGIKNLPIIYRQLENSLLLKMRLGHNTIIEPHLIDEVRAEFFQFPPKGMAKLMNHLSQGQLENALSLYEDLIQDLFYYDYAEIHSTLLYLIYHIYEQLSAKYAMLKDIFIEAMRKFISELKYVEVSDDILALSEDYFKTICNAVQKAKEDPKQQNSVMMAKRIMEIIQQNYSDNTLCLSSIADEMELSSNYTGQIFKQYTQKSISQYLLEIRMEKIAYYLQTSNLPLSEILEKVGLEKNNYFYTRFKNYFGMSLNEYKAQCQANYSDE